MAPHGVCLSRTVCIHGGKLGHVHFSPSTYQAANHVTPWNPTPLLLSHLLTCQHQGVTFGVGLTWSLHSAKHAGRPLVQDSSLCAHNECP